MGLLTTYGAANRVVESDTAVSYSRAFTYGEWTYASGLSLITLKRVWEIHRYRRKTYKYVGMDKTTADTCAAAMTTLYTRTTKVSVWPSSNNNGEFVDVPSGSLVMADVSVQQVAGEMYEVRVSVNEDDVRLRVSDAANPSSLFTAENARSYDTGD